MTLPSARLTFLIIFLGCAGLMLTGMYMEHVMDLYPCPLCITQRVFIVAVGLTALLAFLFNPKQTGRRIFAVTGIIFAVIGGGVSIRQLWLQSLPEGEAPACGPDIGYLLENFPLWDAVSVMFRGDGNCAEVTWTFLGISIPGWTLVAFIGLIGFNVWQIVRRA